MSHLHLLPSRLPFGLLLGAVGGTLLGGGVALTIVEEPEAAPTAVPEGYVVVERSMWERLQAQEPPPWQEDVEPSAELPPTGVEPLPGGAVETGPGPTPRPRGALSHGSAATPGGASGPPPTLAQGLAEAATRAPPAPATPPSRPSAGAAPRPAPESQPQLHDEMIREFESVLARLRREPVVPAIPPPSVYRPSRTTDRCLACGTLVTAYLEQVCVVCDRPLCDRCLDATIVAGHPSVCDGCQGSVRT